MDTLRLIGLDGWWMDTLRLIGCCERCLIDVWHYNVLLGCCLVEVTPWYLVCHTTWFWLIATLETPFWSLASSRPGQAHYCFFFWSMPSVFLHAEVKLLWRGQAGQLGHKLQTGDDGHKHPHPPYSHTPLEYLSSLQRLIFPLLLMSG